MKTNLGELICGDSLQILKTIPDKSIDLVLTDPPYYYSELAKRLKYPLKSGVINIANISYKLEEIGVTKQLDYKKYLFEFKRVTKKVNFLIWCSRRERDNYISWAKSNNYRWYELKWIKSNPAPLNNPYNEDTEYCIWIYESGVLNYDKNKKTYWIHPTGQEKNGHPTPKPLEIIKSQIRKHSKNGDTILDCFLGSGTTAVACEQLNRKWIGIEINKEYYEIAKKRLLNIQITLFD